MDRDETDSESLLWKCGGTTPQSKEFPIMIGRDGETC
jgi:hypothetical protein